jgi:voltage-dependent calcium channel T type alpha-1G
MYRGSSVVAGQQGTSMSSVHQGVDSESDVPLSDLEDEDEDEEDEEEEEEEEDLPYPGFIPLALGCLEQHTKPRSWCLRMITNPYPFQYNFYNLLDL